MCRRRAAVSPRSAPLPYFCFCFFNDTATTEIYTLSLHDALPIFVSLECGARRRERIDHPERLHFESITADEGELFGIARPEDVGRLPLVLLILVLVGVVLLLVLLL